MRQLSLTIFALSATGSSAASPIKKDHKGCVQITAKCKEGDYAWCKDHRVGGCKGPWAQCDRIGGCLDFKNVKDPSGVKIYSSKDRQAATREKADQLIAKGIDFTVIYDHPEHLKDHDSLPKVDPPNPEAFAQAKTHKELQTVDCSAKKNPHVRWVVHHEPEKFYAQKGNTMDHWELGENSEYATCRDAKDAAIAWAKNYKSEEVHGPHILKEAECTAVKEAGVKYEFKGFAYDSCAAAKEAALKTVKVVRPVLPAPKVMPPPAAPTCGTVFQAAPVIQAAPVATCGTACAAPTCR